MKKWLGLIVLAAVVLRVGAAVWIGERHLVGTDAGAYVGIAKNILAGNGFATTAGGFHRAWYAPLYPLLLTAPFGLTNHPFIITLIAQALLVAGMILISYRLTLLATGRPRAGLFAAALVAFDPFLFYFSLLLLTEILFTLLGLLFLWLLVEHAPAAKRDSFFLGAGFILGLAALTRPVILAYYWVAALGLIVYGPRPPARQAWRAILVGLACAAVMLPWVVRNHNLFHKFVPVTLQSGMALYAGNNPLNTRGGGLGGGIDYDTPPIPGFDAMTELEQSEALNRVAIAYIVEHPGKFLRMIPIKLGRLLSVFPAETSGHTSWYHHAASFASYGLALPFLLAGLWLLRRQWRRLWPLYAYLLFNLVFVAVYYGTIRFRVPLIPLFAVWTAAGLDAALARWRPPRSAGA